MSLGLRSLCVAAVVALMATPAVAETYDLVLDEQKITAGGASFEAMSINGSVPGPTLTFTEGEVAVINVTNHLNEPASIHWHGLLVPARMDGVPNLNGFTAIEPGETFVYRFRVKQSGTYWYHSHSMGQEQMGLYGPIVIVPKKREEIKADRDYVVMLSEVTQKTPEQILRSLGVDSEESGQMSHSASDTPTNESGHQSAQDHTTINPNDISNLTSYTYLINGKAEKDNWTGLFKPGERVRLRFINGGAMTLFDVRIPGLSLSVVSADGVNVVPVSVDEFRIAPGETYDVVVQPKDGRGYAIMAESTDGAGTVCATLATSDGPAKKSVPPNSGDKQDTRVLQYSDLKAKVAEPTPTAPLREITMRLGGERERYLWTIDGHQHHDAPPLKVKFGERLRLVFVNETLIDHPMHLHGMFFELDQGLGPRNPKKHTVNVPPGQSVAVLVTANAFGKWALHCHLLYHMLAGMMTELTVLDADGVAPPWY